MDLYDEMKRWEGDRDYPYDDATGRAPDNLKGNLSIGVGRNLEAKPLSGAVKRLMFEEDVDEALKRLIRVFGEDFWDSLRLDTSRYVRYEPYMHWGEMDSKPFNGVYSPRQYALLNLSFWGLPWDSFPNFVAEVKEEEWTRAAAELMYKRPGFNLNKTSLYLDHPRRVEYLCNILISGELRNER